MPAKKVLQYECDRCPNVWYVPENAKEQPAVNIEIKMDLPGAAPVSLKFSCLCEGCAKTVAHLVDSAGKVTKKVSANRKAKKKVDEATDKDSSSPAASTTTQMPAVAPVTQMKPTPPNVVSVPAVAAAGGAAGKPLPLASNHPKR
jgi:hypothetical protein